MGPDSGDGPSAWLLAPLPSQVVPVIKEHRWGLGVCLVTEDQDSNQDVGLPLVLMHPITF